MSVVVGRVNGDWVCTWRLLPFTFTLSLWPGMRARVPRRLRDRSRVLAFSDDVSLSVARLLFPFAWALSVRFASLDRAALSEPLTSPESPFFWYVGRSSAR